MLGCRCSTPCVASGISPRSTPIPRGPISWDAWPTGSSFSSTRTATRRANAPSLPKPVAKRRVGGSCADARRSVCAITLRGEPRFPQAKSSSPQGLPDVGKQFLAGHWLVEESEHTQLLGACAAYRITAPGDDDNGQFRCCVVLFGEIIKAAGPGKMEVQDQAGTPAGNIVARKFLARWSRITGRSRKRWVIQRS
jgi:hypothetical protein